MYSVLLDMFLISIVKKKEVIKYFKSEKNENHIDKHYLQDTAFIMNEHTHTDTYILYMWLSLNGQNIYCCYRLQ